MKDLIPVAGNGLLDRRAFLRGGAAFAAAMTAYSAKAETLTDPAWSKEPGELVPAYGGPSKYEKAARTLSNPKGEPRTQHARTPHHLLQGTATPNGLHFTISHAGNADIDPPHLSRSVPLPKIMDDAMVALYQNGERVMPGQGYPMRLLLPGWEGNMNVKWLRRLELTELPGMSYYESRTYTPILPNGKAYRFFFLQEVKSFITQPSVGLAMKGPGFYEISGIAYSGNGKVTKVVVSADGGKTWAEAALQEPVMSKSFTRFRIPWNWNGGPAVLQSRAWDEQGNVQPTRAEIIAHRGQAARVPAVTAFPSQHFNGITSWSIDAKGEVRHVYA